MRLVPISEVAQKYGKTVAQVRYAIQQQRLPGTKNGWCWFCEENLLPNSWPDTFREKLKRGRKKIE